MRLEKQFLTFHQNNPEVYRLLVHYARFAKARGNRSQYAIAAIFERVRWHLQIETKSDDDFKLNNNHRAFYARLIMEQEPDLAGFFEIRVRRAA